MVQDQLIGRGIKDPRVIKAMRKVARHEFIPNEFRQHAYEDHPIGIGHGQTISQPFMVAAMTEALQLSPEDLVLEIGTGCGYQTAILAELSREVYSIERIAELSQDAQINLGKLQYQNVHLKVADGTLGWQQGLTFDAILVAAAAPDAKIPFLEELKTDGRLVIPLGDRHDQTLCRITKTEGGLMTEEICRCVFVPLIGQHGWRN